MMDIVLLIKNVFRLLMTHRNDDKKIPFDIENFIGLLSKKNEKSEKKLKYVYEITTGHLLATF